VLWYPLGYQQCLFERLPVVRRLRAAFLLPLLCLSGCAAAPPVFPDPHVTMPDGRLRTAALECAARGYVWVARTGPHSAYCLMVNLADEPEAIAVATLIERAP
jgi:hypothetical protein